MYFLSRSFLLVKRTEKKKLNIPLSNFFSVPVALKLFQKLYFTVFEVRSIDKLLRFSFE